MKKQPSETDKTQRNNNSKFVIICIFRYSTGFCLQMIPRSIYQKTTDEDVQQLYETIRPLTRRKNAYSIDSFKKIRTWQNIKTVKRENQHVIICIDYVCVLWFKRANCRVCAIKHQHKGNWQFFRLSYCCPIITDVFYGPWLKC